MDPSDKGKLEAIRGRKATGLGRADRDSRVAEEGLVPIWGGGFATPLRRIGGLPGEGGPRCAFVFSCASRDGSRGSYIRRARLYDGIGLGLVIHESFGIEATDVVVYNQARFFARINGVVVKSIAPIFIERTLAISGRLPRWAQAANDCWIDRPLVIGWGTPGDRYFSHGIWTTGSRNCHLVGATVTGGIGDSMSSGIHWSEGGAGGVETVHIYRAEAFSNRSMGFHSWQTNTPQQRIVDLLAWHNDAGVGWGAYATAYRGHQIRALGNNVQLTHFANGWRITGFLADGLGRPGAIGIRVGFHGARDPIESLYEDGVVRGVTENLSHEPSRDPGSRSWAQFARITWDAGRRVYFDGVALPPAGSRLSLRLQSGLSRPSNFTLYRRDDPGAPAGAVLDAEYNALRVDNDTTGTPPQTPRVRLVGVADDAVATGLVTLVAESNGSTVQFHLGNRVLATVPVVGGRATYTFDMATHAYRRAYFWALATGANGATNASRVIRVRRF
jgi:hypothetical protein